MCRITADYQENERRLADFIQDKMVQWYRAAGAMATEKTPVGTMGPTTHAYGGTRMGDNPETNVVDRWGFSHEVPNLGVLGASVMGTSGARNPTLTAQALAWRTARASGDQLEIHRGMIWSSTMKAGVVAVLVMASSIALAAQWLGQTTPGIPRTPNGKPNLAAPAPRAPDGKPDLSGLWSKSSVKYARNIAADLKPDDLRPATRDTVERRREDLGKDGMQVRCLPLGPAYPTSGDSTGSEMMRIVQTPQLIVMLNPDLTYRQIWMDGRALETNPNPSWMGYSVGRWEGDTLVVESVGFHPGTWLDRDGHPHTEQLRLTERYRRPTFGTAGDGCHLHRSRRLRAAMDGKGRRRLRARHRDAGVGVQRGRGPQPGALDRAPPRTNVGTR